MLANPARFDIKKAEAINGTHIRMLDPRTSAAGSSRTWGRRLRRGEADRTEEEILAEAAPLIQERISLLGEAPEMLAFLFKNDDAIDVADDARKGLPENLDRGARRRPGGARPVDDWNAENIQAALKRPWWRAWASSPAWHSARSARPSPGAGSHRRCSSPW